MIKAVIVGGERRLLLLGLSEKNVERLRDGQPIQFRGEDIGIQGWDIAIAHGQTEESLAGDLRAAGFLVPPAV